MHRIPASKPGDRLFRPSRAKPWVVPLQVIRRARNVSLPSGILIYGFVVLIALGTLLLMLPLSSRSGQFTSLIDALFTATSAVCVTGLVVVDTATYWSSFGQGVILLLMQVGGFGFMTSATLLFLAVGRRIGLRERLLIGESIGLATPGGVIRTVRRIAVFTVIAEVTGVIILYLRLLAYLPPGEALWSAVFHAISAFNNAGFDIMGSFSSLQGYRYDMAIVLTIGGLVILGGLSYMVVADVLKRRRFSRLKADSRIVLVMTASLLVLGTVMILLAEQGNTGTLGTFPAPWRWLTAFFQSLTARTSGFTLIDIGKMTQASLFFTMFLMFIGGASGSLAGGVKVNTFGVLMAAVLSALKGREHIHAFGRELPDQNVHRALALVTAYLAVVALVVLALSLTESASFIQLLFETFSAASTVGLSTGITPGLSEAGRLIIIITMFLGRLGPLTLASLMAQQQQPTNYRLPKETVRIG